MEINVNNPMQVKHERLKKVLNVLFYEQTNIKQVTLNADTRLVESQQVFNIIVLCLAVE